MGYRFFRRPQIKFYLLLCLCVWNCAVVGLWGCEFVCLWVSVLLARGIVGLYVCVCVCVCVLAFFSFCVCLRAVCFSMVV